MSDIRLSERTFSQGKNRWRVDDAGRWSVLLWGWFPTGVSPRYQWEPIERGRVPLDILKAAGEKP